jgi:RNA polymerase sigma-70 factor (ECF subfamily)
MTKQFPIHAEAVFEILVRENADMLMTYLRAVVWQASAVDDLFQETMLVAWRRLPEYNAEKPFGPWLRGIAARLVMAHARKAKRDLMICDDTVLEYLDQQVQRISQRNGDTWDDKVAALRECLAAQAETPKEAISLRYLEGLSAKKIAEQLDIAIEAVKKRLQRGRAQLLDCLQRKGVLWGPES